MTEMKFDLSNFFVGGYILGDNALSSLSTTSETISGWIIYSEFFDTSAKHIE